MHHLVLDATMISGVDAAAVGAIQEVQSGLLHNGNISFEVARTIDELREQFDATGLTVLIGHDHFHATVTAAVQVCVASRG